MKPSAFCLLLPYQSFALKTLNFYLQQKQPVTLELLLQDLKRVHSPQAGMAGNLMIELQ